MIPQLIGNRKSKGFRACERYFKERRIEFQTRDPGDRPLSPRELDTIRGAVTDPLDLINDDSPQYRTRGLQYMEFDPMEEIADDPRLLRQPIVRTDRGVVIEPSTADLDRLLRDG